MTRRIAFLSNPRSGVGDGHQGRDLVIRHLRAGGAEVTDVVGHDAAESLALVRRAVGDGVDTVVVSGGDGLIHLAVQALAGSGTALGIVPAGTGNDAARAFGLPLDDPMAAAAVVVRNRRRGVDLARSGDSWYLTVLATGFDALVAKRGGELRWPRNNLRYTVAVARELPRFRPLRYTLSLDGRERTLDAMFVSVANTDYFGGGMRIGAGAACDDGLLDVVIVKPMSRLSLVRFFPTVNTGQHVHNPAYERIRARSVTIAITPPVTSYADGERFGEVPLTVECIPGALQVLT
ncbi:YegS/Rv2252/BmrU family lipid kinase [Nocardioides sp. BP30]|uniref:diacylglycerol/lipid kinase family protein n=1 Tax=Nocardioides sp. BP30 TaxID=3036374 RepID=UPI0024692FC2|nr:YegS/Rv2252/BmrU family lipid kinase [Nocardioides sp. BP30]WGL50763.1 YegS/Rv2252/BmrU family lipid kinase [Nocardioides sp. BP30]